MENVLKSFEDAWQQGLNPRIEDWLTDCHQDTRQHLLQELLGIELWWRKKAGQHPRLEDYLARFHDANNEIHAAFAEFNAISASTDPREVLTDDSQGNDKTLLFDSSTSSQPRSQSSLQFGRYRVESLLGSGGFGEVYRAWDDQLNRAVAIKVTLRKFVSADTSDAFLNEARTVAALDHPHIVPVFDVGQSTDGDYFVVSKLIEGSDLASVINQRMPTLVEAVEIVASIADALNYAHGLGLVHRDVKPANILIDHQSRAYLTDFGIALREAESGQGPQYVGTPAYMSPEQARGEGHRVDGRSDIFSLGVVLYELLAAQKPFLADTQMELLDKVTQCDPRPLREYDAGLPQELERICFKALAKKANDRYSTASDLLDDLQQFLVEQKDHTPETNEGTAENPTELSVPQKTDRLTSNDPVSGDSLNIVPKGLRSFDAGDASFFLGLLPGARDRDGLPESVRFWKSGIEQKDRESAFAVGLIYGPSGCGKSSLVKAGLIPRLSSEVVPVYVESTSNETESRLLNALRKHFPLLDQRLSCKDSLAALRRGQGLPRGKKLVIFLDQFEQWLHAKNVEGENELVQALRQCDGGRIQCILMVRDDFWLAVSRFLHALEVRLIEGVNSALVDLFDLDHARKVLAAFGRAFGKLPESASQLTKEQRSFIKQAVDGLNQDGKVISVRLALFAEMMKSREWTPNVLREVGGTEGIGVTFLEETFSAASAPPEHRYHQEAARNVLKAMLPEAGTDIKGHMQSYPQLLASSGYADRKGDFEALIELLDKKIRLITPTDPHEASGENLSAPPSAADQRCYQLTHDYLVPLLRNWLNRKQKETRKGRAELLLGDRAAVWNSRPDNRQLVSSLQWIQIRLLTDSKKWTQIQRKMMRKASRFHFIRMCIVTCLLAIATLAGNLVWQRVSLEQKSVYASALVKRLLDADTNQVPSIINEMTNYRQWTDPMLRNINGGAPADSPQKLHSSLALLPVDATQVDYLSNQLLHLQPRDVRVIIDSVLPHGESIVGKLWAVFDDADEDSAQQRLRAAAALATYDPTNPLWADHSVAVVDDLMQENSLHVGYWREALRAVKLSLMEPLLEVYRDRRIEHQAEQNLAADLLEDYATDQPAVLANLIMDGNLKQFERYYPQFISHAEQGLPLLNAELDRQLKPVSTDWKINFHKWNKVTPNEPPTNWRSVIDTPVINTAQSKKLCLQSLPKPYPSGIDKYKSIIPKALKSSLDTVSVPARKVPGTYFGTVAVTDLELERSEYELSISYDDAVRIWLDDKLLFHEWGKNESDASHIRMGELEGKHQLKIEHYQIENEYTLVADVHHTVEVKEQLARRQANASIGLLRANQGEKVWPLLKHTSEPLLRSYLVNQFGSMRVDMAQIVEQLESETDVSIRRALLLSLGEFPFDENTMGKESKLFKSVQSIYINELDPGLHSAAEWLIRHWKLKDVLREINKEQWKWRKGARNRDFERITKLFAKEKETPPLWFVNGKDQTFVAIQGPVEFMAGPTNEWRSTRINRSFAVATKPVTLFQYRQFEPSWLTEDDSNLNRANDLPAVKIDWFRAARYCNWLSKEEGIPEDQWCYNIDPAAMIYTLKIVMKPNYLSLTGYRMPTEAEFEYVTRAGANSNYFFGETQNNELIGKYARFRENSNGKSGSVGSFKPNDFGFFDVHGNVWEWCFARRRLDPVGSPTREDVEGRLVFDLTIAPALRGGCFYGKAPEIKASAVTDERSNGQYHQIGFRVARTLPVEAK